uniref:Cyclin-dependent kinase inhibitor 1B n=2 Tax=Gouania willdenowi TaxID=441366 RepID=A0A8C5HTT5_GOUWI
MSDVRLSNASPTLGRVEARQPPENTRTSARRILFGPPDRAEIQRYVAETLQENVQAFRDKYNFDPVEDRPLTPRNYEWVEDDDPPEFYLRPPHRRPPAEAGTSTRREEEDEEHGAAATERKTCRKRPCVDSGGCQSKIFHTDKNDDDDDESDGGSRHQISV